MRRYDCKRRLPRQNRRTSGQWTTGIVIERLVVRRETGNAAVLAEPEISLPIAQHTPERRIEEPIFRSQLACSLRVTTVDPQRPRAETDDPEVAVARLDDVEDARLQLVIHDLRT